VQTGFIFCDILCTQRETVAMVIAIVAAATGCAVCSVRNSPAINYAAAVVTVTGLQLTR